MGGALGPWQWVCCKVIERAQPKLSFTNGTGNETEESPIRGDDWGTHEANVFRQANEKAYRVCVRRCAPEMSDDKSDSTQKYERQGDPGETPASLPSFWSRVQVSGCGGGGLRECFEIEGQITSRLKTQFRPLL